MKLYILSYFYLGSPKDSRDSHNLALLTPSSKFRSHSLSVWRRLVPRLHDAGRQDFVRSPWGPGGGGGDGHGRGDGGHGGQNAVESAFSYGASASNGGSGGGAASSALFAGVVRPGRPLYHTYQVCQQSFPI